MRRVLITALTALALAGLTTGCQDSTSAVAPTAATQAPRATGAATAPDASKPAGAGDPSDHTDKPGETKAP